MHNASLPLVTHTCTYYRLNAVDNMLKMWPLVPEQDMRSFLGKFRISGNLALRPLKFLSGGQKSRVAFAALAYTRPHIVIMDEPVSAVCCYYTLHSICCIVMSVVVGRSSYSTRVMLPLPLLVSVAY
jgi:ABC-type Mn2+/Zn2+ transport system ATPase subunit